MAEAGRWWSTVVMAAYMIAYYQGYMLVCHIFAYIAIGFLIACNIMMKKEWLENPPLYYVEEQIEKQRREQAEQEAARRREQREQQRQIHELSKNYIERCGMRFFIKYYRQIKRLPIRDVLIDENYSPIEKEDRLAAAKSIIDEGLTKYVVQYILKTCSDVLTEDEIAAAKSILKDQ